MSLKQRNCKSVFIKYQIFETYIKYSFISLNSKQYVVVDTKMFFLLHITNYEQRKPSKRIQSLTGGVLVPGMTSICSPTHKTIKVFFGFNFIIRPSTNNHSTTEKMHVIFKSVCFISERYIV